MEKKTNLVSKIKAVLFIMVLISTLSSIVFAATKGSNAKKFYLDALNKISSRLDKMEESSILGAKFEDIVISRTFDAKADYEKYNEELKEYEDAEEGSYEYYYLQELKEIYEPNGEDLIKERLIKLKESDPSLYEIMLNSHHNTVELYHDYKEYNEERIILDMENKNFYKKEIDNDSVKERYYNSSENKLYAKKEDGTVVFCIPEASMLEEFEDIFEVTNKNYKEVYKIIEDALIKNLKDDYFKDSKENGINVYTISFNKEQFKEYIVNVITDLFNSNEFKEIVLKEAEIDESEFYEALPEAIESIKEIFDEIEDLKIELSVMMKGNDFAGIRFELKLNDDILQFELMGEKGKALKKSTNGTLKINYKSNSEEYVLNGLISCNKKEIVVELTTHSLTQTINWKTYSYEPKVSDHKMTFTIKGLDGKELRKSSKIQLEHYIENCHDGCVYNDYKYIIESNNKKSLDKADEITIKYIRMYCYDENKKPIINNDKVVIHGDNKELLKSKQITFDYFIGEHSEYDPEDFEEEYDEEPRESIIIKSNDGKELSKSLDMSLEFYYEDELESKMNIKMNDRSIKKLNYFLLTVDDDIYIFEAKCNDKKNFFESTDFEVNFTDKNYPNGSFSIKIKSLDKLGFKDTKKLQIEALNEGINYLFVFESKDNKSILESNNMKITFEFKEISEDTEIKGVIDGRNIDINAVNSYMSYCSRFTENYIISFKELDKFNFNDVMNTSNAVEVSRREVADILGIYYFDFEEFYNSMMSSYYDELEEENFYEVVEDSIN